MAAAGSAVGGLLPYGLGRAGGELFLLKRINRQRFEAMRTRFESQEFWALAIPSMLPPPTPWKVVVFAAGVFEMRCCCSCWPFSRAPDPLADPVAAGHRTGSRGRSDRGAPCAACAGDRRQPGVDRVRCVVEKEAAQGRGIGRDEPSAPEQPRLSCWILAPNRCSRLDCRTRFQEADGTACTRLMRRPARAGRTPGHQRSRSRSGRCGRTESLQRSRRAGR